MPDMRTRWHCAIIQAEGFPHQLEVAQWIQEHDADFQAIWILHDRDKKSVDSVEQEIDSENPEDDSDEHFYSDKGAVLPHYHYLLRLPDRVSPVSLSKSFCGYVNFRRCSSPLSYYKYMLHRSFAASFDECKHKYELDDIQTNDVDFYHSFFRSALGGLSDEKNVMERVFTYLQECGGDMKTALILAIDAGDWVAVKDIKTHSYFYSKFFM